MQPLSNPLNLNEWEEVYSSAEVKHKNKYPSKTVVSFILGRHRGKGFKVLDIGCGFGNNLRFLLDNGFDAFGVDFSRNVISQIHDEFPGRVSCGNALNLEFDDDYFDLTIDRSSLQHNPKSDLPAIFRECRRVLQPGGEFFSDFLTEGNNGFLLSCISEQELLMMLHREFHDIECETHTKFNHQTKSKLVASIVIAK